MDDETKAGRIGIANVLKRLPLYYGEDFAFLIESSLESRHESGRYGYACQ